MKSGLLHAENLAYIYHDGTRALDGVSIALGQNVKAAILGPNGAGKSTLFLHFNGLLRPHRGTVYYKGQALQYHKKALQVLRREIGIVFQNPDNQLFSASVLQDISFGLLNQGCKPAEARRRVEEIGFKLGIEHLFSKPTHFLSVGQKKMVALAGVLVMEPELIICDEPTAGLDPGNAECFMQLLDGLHQQGKTMLISTHDVDLAYQWADEVWLLNQGKVMAQGSPVEVFSRAEALQAARLKTPWLLEIWQEMARLGLSPTELPPRNKTQLRQSMLNLKPEAG